MKLTYSKVMEPSYMVEQCYVTFCLNFDVKLLMYKEFIGTSLILNTLKFSLFMF